MRRNFPDHHRYRARDLAPLLARATDENAPLITTAKDAVRLPADIRNRVMVLPVTVQLDDPAALMTLLAPALIPPYANNPATAPTGKTRSC